MLPNDWTITKDSRKRKSRKSKSVCPLNNAALVDKFFGLSVNRLLE